MLLPYSPTKIGNFEKSCVEESIQSTTLILLKLLPTNPMLYLSVLVRIFDKNCPYYKGKLFPVKYIGNNM